jgi:hypothetical protein
MLLLCDDEEARGLIRHCSVKAYGGMGVWGYGGWGMQM